MTRTNTTTTATADRCEADLLTLARRFGGTPCMSIDVSSHPAWKRLLRAYQAASQPARARDDLFDPEKISAAVYLLQQTEMEISKRRILLTQVLRSIEDVAKVDMVAAFEVGRAVGQQDALLFEGGAR
jgi:hypothetical protein